MNTSKPTAIYALERMTDLDSTQEFNRYKALSAFYNSRQQMKKAWDHKKARLGEFDRAFKAMLQCAGFSRKKKHAGKSKDQFIFGFGNAAFQFGANTHTSFERFAVLRLQSLGLKVVAVNEYFTFQKCLRCHDFVDSVGVRVKHCSSCVVYFHRDVMAAHNMVNILKN